MRRLLAFALLVYVHPFDAPCRCGQQAANLSQPHDRVASGTIKGTATGPRGAAVAGASVRIINTQSGAPVEVRTDGDGRFKVTDLPFGKYEVVVAAEGLRSYHFVDVLLVDDKGRLQELTFNVEMDPATYEVLRCPIGTVESLEGLNIVPESIGVRPRRVFVSAATILRRAYKVPTRRPRSSRPRRGKSSNLHFR